MEFRWVALLALWTLISGPLLGVPSGKVSSASKPNRAEVRTVKALAKHADRR
jgi:hypothetical protein